MRLVAPRVAEIDFAVLDDGVVPVRDVERAVGADLDVDWAERRVVALDDLGHFLARKAAAVVAELEPADAVRAEVARDQVALPVGGKMFALDDLEPAMLGAAGVEAADDAFGFVSGNHDAAGEDEVDPLVARAVGGEHVPLLVPRHPPRVDESRRKDAELLRARVVLPKPAGHQPLYPVRRFDVAVDVDRLSKEHRPARRPAEGVDDVVRVLGAKSAQNDLALVRFPVAVGVLEV